MENYQSLIQRKFPIIYETFKQHCKDTLKVQDSDFENLLDDDFMISFIEIFLYKQGVFVNLNFYNGRYYASLTYRKVRYEIPTSSNKLSYAMYEACYQICKIISNHLDEDILIFKN